MHNNVRHALQLLALICPLGLLPAILPADDIEIYNTFSDPPPRVPLPDQAAIKEAQKLLRGMYAANIAKAKTLDRKTVLLNGMFENAKSSTSDPAGKYVLLNMVVDFALQENALKAAFTAIDQIDKSFLGVDPCKMKMDALAKVSKRPSPNRWPLFESAMALADQAIAEDHYDTAQRAAELATAAAKSLKDVEAIKDAAAQSAKVKDIAAAYAALPKPSSQPATGRANDPQANLTFGRFDCFVKARWDKGIPKLAAGSDEKLSAIAKKELDKPHGLLDETKEKLEAADAWLEVAAKEDPPAQRKIAEHAIELYEIGLWRMPKEDHPDIEKKIKKAEGFIPRPARPRATGTYLDLGDGVTLPLVLIPAGRFMMGGPDDPKLCDRNSHPQHEVRITRPFHMGACPVTQEQYQQVMGCRGFHFRGPNLPADEILWSDADQFCKELSKKTGKTVKLPTEAQWEYACRAGTTTLYNVGNTISCDQANFDASHPCLGGKPGRFRGRSLPVGSFKPNAWGLYDMHGNIAQWCQDFYDERYYNQSPAADPQGPEKGKLHVLRGGSWRLWSTPSFSRMGEDNMPSADWGFRIIVEIK